MKLPSDPFFSARVDNGLKMGTRGFSSNE